MNAKKYQKSARILSLAIGGAVGYGLFDPALFAATRTWTFTGPTPATWSNASNWNTGTPSSGDTALFVSPTIPPNNTVLVDTNITVGAIVDTIKPTTNLTLTGTASVILNGQTVTVPEPSGFGANSFTQGSVILSNTSSLTTSKTLTLDSNLHVFLNQPTNYIIASPGSGGSAGTQIKISGSVSDGSNGSAGIVFLGGGNASTSGGTLVLNGNNNFTGGLTIGTPDGTQGGAVSVSSAANLPTTGGIVVNDQGQLAFSAAGTYGVAGQLLTINGIGENKNSSGAIRTGGNATDFFAWNGDLSIGTSSIADGNDGFVVISVTSAATKKFQLNGKFTGTGKLQKQGQGDLVFAGTNNDNTGDTQIGNGVIDVLAGSQMGTGNLDLFQTSNNTTTVNLFNANQVIGALSSHFTATSGGSPSTDTQLLNIGDPNNGTPNGQILTIKQKSDTSFGSTGADSSLISVIQGPGGIVMDSSSDHTLTLIGSNGYLGGTTINGGTLSLANGTNGSAVGSGAVIVNLGGALSSGNAVQFGSPVASGKMTGTLTVASGGIVAPGAASTIGSLTVGTLQANNGSVFDFDLQGATHALSDKLIATGSVTLNAGTETINVLGSQLAAGTYQLISFQNGSLSSGASFTLGSTPGGTNRTYSLTTSSTGVLLTITNTGSDWNWSPVSSGTFGDGAGTWQDGSVSFYRLGVGSAAYNSGDSLHSDVIFGATGAGGVVTLGSAVTVGGNLIFDNVSSPYTIGTVGGTNTLTLSKGMYGAASATINAPIVLQNSQTFSVATGATITVNGPISDNGSARGLTKADVGTLVLNGTATYTGGTTISGGALQATTSTLPAVGGMTNNSLLVFRQGTSGAYSGQISGSGSIVINNTSPSAAITLSNASNTYTGATVVQAGILSVSSPGQLGSGDGGIILAGGTFQAGADLSFPKNSGSPPDRTITLASNTISTIDTNGHNVTFNQNIGGPGGFTKIGAGSLTLTGLPSTTVLGTVSILGGSVVLAPPAAVPSFGWSAPNTPNNYTGDIVIAQPMELRLFGGTFSGGGALRDNISGTVIDSRAQVGNSNPLTVFANNIILNGANSPGFSTDIGAQAGSTLTISGVISGNSDVDFTSGAGTVQLLSSNTYVGNTTIDNGAGGAVILMINGALPAASSVHITSTGTFDLNGFQQTIASLDAGSGSASIYNNATAANKPSTLTISGSGSTQFAGLISDGNINKMSLQLGAGNTGTLYLSGSNLYTGGNFLNGGTLIVDQDLALGQDPLSGATTSTLGFGGGALDITTSFDTTGRPLIVNSGNSTISVASGQTFGLLGNAVTTWNGGTLTVSGGGTMNLNRSGGTVSVAPGSTFGVGTASTATVNASSADPFTDSAVNTKHVAIVNNGTLAITSGNTVIAQHTGSGTLIIGSGANVTLASNPFAVVSRAGVLTIAAGSKLDLTDNDLIVDSTSLATIQGYLSSGYDHGAWDGTGIISSTAAASASTFPKTSIGSATASSLGINSFNGMPVNPSSVIVKYTYAGDANLDGKVDMSDLVRLAQHWNTTGDTWATGDFNYDGKIDVQDLYVLAKDWQDGVGSPLAPSLSAMETALGLPQISVPEPSCLGLLLGGALLARRPRKRRVESK